MLQGDACAAILVIGATGFIGRQVVHHLLSGGRSVIAMARARGELSAQARVMRAVRCIPAAGRLEVIEADLRKPHYGLTPEGVRRLRDTVDTVIHCAGETAFFPTDMGRFRAGHIDGPLGLCGHRWRLRRTHGRRHCGPLVLATSSRPRTLEARRWL